MIKSEEVMRLNRHLLETKIAMVPEENIRYHPKLELYPTENSVKKYEHLIVNSGNVAPVVVAMSENGQMTLVHGAEALEACRNSKVRKIPAVITATNNLEQEMMLSLHMQTLQVPANMIAISSLLCRLIDDHGISRREIAKALGKSKSWLTLTERLTRDLSGGVRQMVTDELISTRAAEEVARLPVNVQTRFATNAVNNFLNKNQVKELVERYMEPDCGEEERGAIVGDPTRYLSSRTCQKQGRSLLSEGARLAGYLRRCLSACAGLMTFVREIGPEAIIDARNDIQILMGELSILQRVLLGVVDPGQQEKGSSHDS